MFQIQIWFVGEAAPRTCISLPDAAATMATLPRCLVERPDCDRIEVRFGSKLLFTARPYGAMDAALAAAA